MKLTLLSNYSLSTLLLPKKCAGQYWLDFKSNTGNKISVASIEGIHGEAGNDDSSWLLKCSAKYGIRTDSETIVNKTTIESSRLYTIINIESKERFTLYTEPLSLDRKQYNVYEILKKDGTINIGRIKGNQIRYDSIYVSKSHAALKIENWKVSVEDTGSSNHTYVNGHAISSAKLSHGDLIYLMGMQIISVGRFLYINNPDGKVTVSSDVLRAYHPPVYQNKVDEDDTDIIEFDDYYYRPLRLPDGVETLTLKVDPPPAPPTEDEMPILMSIGPAMTMGMASATTAAFSVYNAVASGNMTAAIPSIAMSLGMLSGTLMWPVITKRYQRKRRGEKEQERQIAYLAELERLRQVVQEATVTQQDILNRNDGDTGSYLHRVTASDPQFWERTPKHKDFLQLRLGVGQLPLDAEIEYQERKFSVRKDNLMEAMYHFGEESHWLHDVPICVSLRERYITGIYGSHELLIQFAKSLILQLVTLHSYDEVKLTLIYDKEDEEQLSFVRWLPHVMDNERRIRYIATCPEETKTLSSDLNPVVEYRKSCSSQEVEEELPYYVVICLDHKLAEKTECLHSLFDHKEYINFSVIAMYERLKDMPKECMAIINLQKIPAMKTDEGEIRLINDVCEEPIKFNMDIPQQLDMTAATEVLANTVINVGSSHFQLPKKYTFLEMLDVGMVEHINLLERWKQNDPTKSLAAALGIDRHGEPFVLDIHEAAHGPHGLVAGMTGSGKSETIIAYILSMAINYHPSEVAFILIDYKGGGMAKAFDNIPHTAGIITNLDGNTINRSLVSLRSELHRREEIFQEVSKRYSISNIDIYKYQKLYREGKVKEPLPHLLIISDEFAELKNEQPDFMHALTSTARVGRSLGVHLILATQKPGGVVDEQIRSNSRFRLCLKVQDKGDSMEMLNRGEASELVESGRFYLQVGNNEVFELGQSAWAGAPYHPALKVLKDKDDAITIINTSGRVIAEGNIDPYAGESETMKQLDAVTGYICKVSKAEKIRRWKMWLDPIPSKIYLPDVEEKYPDSSDRGFNLHPLVGEYDNPAGQSQAPLYVPISESGNVILYGAAGSGKGMFLEAMCVSLMKHHTPREVNLYLMDFDSETLSALAAAPHVGDVVLAHEKEKVENLFKLLMGKLNRRKKLFSAYGGSLEQYNNHAEQKESNIVVVIHNYANFCELYEEKTGVLTALSREGVKYGIYFVLTCTGVNNVRFGLLQNFKTMYCFQLNNETDYSVVVGKTEGLMPEWNPGRGMIRLSKNGLYEFQTVSVTTEKTSYSFLRSFSQEMRSKYTDIQAMSIPVLPEEVSQRFLSRYVVENDFSKVPVGVEKESLDIAYWDFRARPVHLVLSVNQEGQTFTEAMAVLLSEQYGVRTILLGDQHTSVLPNRKLSVCKDCNAAVSAVYDIYNQLLIRNNTYKDALEEGKTPPVFDPLFVIVQSIADLKKMLSLYKTQNPAAIDDTPINRLQVAMEKSEKEYQVYFIVGNGINELTPFTAENWYKIQVSGNDGIWIGSGIESQYRLNVSIKPQSYNHTLESDFGYVVQKGKAVLVKFLC